MLTAAGNRAEFMTNKPSTLDYACFGKRGMSVGHSAMQAYGHKENKKIYKDLHGPSNFSALSSITRIAATRDEREFSHTQQNFNKTKPLPPLRMKNTDRSGNATPQDIPNNARVVYSLNERSGGSLMNIVDPLSPSERNSALGAPDSIEIALNM